MRASAHTSEEIHVTKTVLIGRLQRQAQFAENRKETTMQKHLCLIAMTSAALLAIDPLMAAEKSASPADGYSIHIVAPHRHEDGTVHGPYHHYCKTIKPEIMQCLIFMSTAPNAQLVEIEYFIDKKLVRTNVTLAQWNKNYHDHAVEIATGRVQVLDVSPAEGKVIAAAAAKTDGIIFHLWPDGAKVPNGTVTFPTSIGNQHVEKLDVPQ
jgi:hypothetical protein